MVQAPFSPGKKGEVTLNAPVAQVCNANEKRTQPRVLARSALKRSGAFALKPPGSRAFIYIDHPAGGVGLLGNLPDPDP